MAAVQLPVQPSKQINRSTRLHTRGNARRGSQSACTELGILLATMSTLYVKILNPVVREWAQSLKGPCPIVFSKVPYVPPPPMAAFPRPPPPPSTAGAPHKKRAKFSEDDDTTRQPADTVGAWLACFAKLILNRRVGCSLYCRHLRNDWEDLRSQRRRPLPTQALVGVASRCHPLASSPRWSAVASQRLRKRLPPEVPGPRSWCPLAREARARTSGRIRRIWLVWRLQGRSSPCHR